MQQQVSTAMGASQMMSDFFQIFKLALTTKFGLVITLLCTTIYFFTLWFVGSVQNWGLMFWILTLFGTIIMSWLTWFRGGHNTIVEKDY
jgi:hypothetical protein